MPMTTVLANLAGDHFTGKTDIGALGDKWLALFTANPGDSGSVASEVVGTGYARQPLTASMAAFAGKVSTNTAEITFGVPGSDWGTVAYVGVMTDVAAGMMWLYEQLPTPRVAASGGRAVKFAIGKLTLRLV